MNKPFKNLWIRWKWIRRKNSRKSKQRHLKNQKEKKEENQQVPMQQNNQNPQNDLNRNAENPPRRKNNPTGKKNPFWKFLIRLLISLTQLFRLIRLLAGLIRKNWGNSAKN